MNLNASWSAKSSTMSNCLLCHTRLNTRNLIYLDQLLVQDTTLCDAINQQIQFNILPLDKPTTSQVSCRNCFNAFKSFYQFLHKVKSNLRPVKVENFVELPAYEPVRVCTVKIEECPVPDVKFEPVLMLDGYQALNNELDSGQDTPSSISNQNPRMDNSGVESDTLRSNLGILSTNLDNSNPGADPASFRDDSDFEWSCDDPIDSVDERPQIPEEKPAPKSQKRTRVSRELESLKIPESMSSLTSSRKPPLVRIIKPAPKPPKKYIDEDPDFILPGDRNLDKWARYPQNDVEGEAKIKKYVNLDCYVCGTHTGGFIEFKKHFKTSHEGHKPYLMCCGRKFFRRYRLIEHLDSHDKVFPCKMCKRTLKTEKTLSSHIQNFHMNTKKAQCKDCNKVFPSDRLLKTHMQIHFVDESRTIVCYKCTNSKIFKNIFKLKNHLRNYHVARLKEVCSICSKAVRHLKGHMKGHTQKERKRVQCKICDNWFLEASLKGHMLKHTDQAPDGGYCQICGKFYKGGLNIHIQRIHEKKYTHKCPTCDKGFFDVQKLQEHVAVKHTREFLYKCRVSGCDRQFRCNFNWKEHEKRHHPEEYEKFLKPRYKRKPEGL